eukprot:1702831-Karenia_brevis.AAC.1
MPPLEAVKLLCSLLVSKNMSKAGKKLKLQLYDVSRAHFYGEAQRDVYVELPPEMAKEGQCAKLPESMYGTQDAAHIWQNSYTKVLQDGGFIVGKGSTA